MEANCGVGFDYMFENFPLKKMFTLIFKGTGDCAAIDWTFLGLTLPQLGLISFIGFGVYAVYLSKINVLAKNNDLQNIRPICRQHAISGIAAYEPQ